MNEWASKCKALTSLFVCPLIFCVYYFSSGWAAENDGRRWKIVSINCFFHDVVLVVNAVCQQKEFSIFPFRRLRRPLFDVALVFARAIHSFRFGWITDGNRNLIADFMSRLWRRLRTQKGVEGDDYDRGRKRRVESNMISGPMRLGQFVHFANVMISAWRKLKYSIDDRVVWFVVLAAATMVLIIYHVSAVCFL